VFQFVIPLIAAPDHEAPSADTDWSGRRILVVDHNATHRYIYEAQLRHWGLTTVSAATPHEALECLRQQTFDLAVFDFEMPDVNGLQLAQRVADLGLAPAMRIVLSSSSAVNRKQLRQGMDNPPFHAFLMKPTRSDAFRQVIAHLLSGAPAPLVRRTPRDIDTTLAKQRPLRILLAEDNVVNQKVGVAQLKRMGYDPDVVANGLEVLTAVHRQPYDVILMDVQMPEMDGLEAARRIVQEFEVGRRPRVIALTANVFKSDRDACLAAGMDSFLAKPLDVSQLREILLTCRPLSQS
jgi:CheY-like chemotaxis protein